MKNTLEELIAKHNRETLRWFVYIRRERPAAGWFCCGNYKTKKDADRRVRKIYANWDNFTKVVTIATRETTTVLGHEESEPEA